MLLEGAAHRERSAWKMKAWGVAHLINISGKSVKQNTSAEKLLGEKPKPIPKGKPIEVKDPARDFRTLWERHQSRLG